MTAFIIWLSLIGWVYLAFFRGYFWRPLLFAPAPDPDAWPDIDIIVPARDEAASLPRSLPSLLAQDYPGKWRVILVDDHSADGTADVARKLAAARGGDSRLTVIAAPDLPRGWTGKVAAMQAGVAQSKAAYILFTDADIEHPVHNLRRLVARAIEQDLDLVSLMVRLHCRSFAEQLLIPAFVFFFAMLYPFRFVNDPETNLAAAAGGVMLVRRRALDNGGGLARIKSALIDDCALARIIKRNGRELASPGQIELTLARDTVSLRAYPDIRDVWDMIARTAFTQLNFSPLLLAVAVIGMGILFLAPALVPLVGSLSATGLGLATWLFMAAVYLPMVAFYRLPLWWSLTLPAAALVYIGATIDSARLYWQGKGGRWKGRAQAS